MLSLLSCNVYVPRLVKIGGWGSIEKLCSIAAFGVCVLDFTNICLDLKKSPWLSENNCQHGLCMTHWQSEQFFAWSEIYAKFTNTVQVLKYTYQFHHVVNIRWQRRFFFICLRALFTSFILMLFGCFACVFDYWKLRWFWPVENQFRRQLKLGEQPWNTQLWLSLPCRDSSFPAHLRNEVLRSCCRKNWREYVRFCYCNMMIWCRKGSRDLYDTLMPGQAGYGFGLKLIRMCPWDWIFDYV